MISYELNYFRQEWVYTKFINNKNLMLDWPRRMGKSIYSITCILDYALNNPNTTHLITGHDVSANRLLLQKMVMCNFERMSSPIVETVLDNKVIFKNQSVMYFGSKSTNGKIKLDTLFVDELGEFGENKNEFFSVIHHNPNIKLLINCTDFTSMFFDQSRRLFSKYQIPLYVDYYKTDEEVMFMLRRKKIEKIKTISSGF